MDTELLRRVGFFCALWTLQCCSSVLGAISRDAIFLRSYSASSVALLTLLLSLSTAYALTMATQILDRLAARPKIRPGVLYAVSPAILGSVLLLLTLLSLAAPALAPVVSVALYLWLEVSTQWLTQQFWDLCAKAFDVAQSKKFFGVITFGSTFGSLLASFVVLPVLQSRQLPTECNLLVSSGMLFFVAGVLLLSAEKNIASGQSGVKKTEKTKKSSGGTDASSSAVIISDIQARTYLKHICFFDMLATVMRVLVDNTTLTVVSLQPEEEVKASLSMINGLQSFLMIPMQLLSGPFFTHFGVMYGISMLPVTIFLFGASTYVSNSAYSLIFTRALYNAVSQAIFNPARQLLWLPFNENERGRFQNFVCGPFRSLSRIFGAVLSMILTASVVTQLIGTSSASMLMIATSVAWFVDALAARKSYASEFYASLRQGYLDLTSPLVDFTPDQVLESRVVGLKIVGKQLPELLGDGFLVYLLHHSSPQIVQAAVACCSNSSRTSRMLIPALMKHLSDSVLRSQIVAALKGFEPVALWGPLCQYTEQLLQTSPGGSSSAVLASDQIQNKREGLAGALKVLDVSDFPLEDKLNFLLHLVETLLMTSKVQKDDEIVASKLDKNSDVLHNLFGKDVIMEELVVDALLSLVAATDEKTMNSFSQLMDPIHHALSTKIREAHEMRHVLVLFNHICPRTATNIEETSPLLLQHVEHSLKDTLRLLLKLLSTGFPKEFNVAVILEGMQSDVEQVHSAIQMEQTIVEKFDGKNGVDILLDVMKHSEEQLELSALALQYFLHIAADHAEHLGDEAKQIFQDEIIPNLLAHELTKELLIETYHSRPEVLPYNSVTSLKDCEPPLLSSIALLLCMSSLRALFNSTRSEEFSQSWALARALDKQHFYNTRFMQGPTYRLRLRLRIASF
ncbi:hypothetical protein PHYBOEH_005230 [Phytophthora boehmeriae]|uniref:ADP,ATP carrier protein n=1 Tax=Phytophthora boehmeriae TaxID=109152 RepID=A0A8T1WKF5_9STRA|nr:hypothetical protein PHYBOEH_005230 [Phytophthora boehmeriae]